MNGRTFRGYLVLWLPLQGKLIDSLGIWMVPILIQPGDKLSVSRLVPCRVEIPLSEYMTQPCESRGSRTVLGAPGGEIPPGDSPDLAVRTAIGISIESDPFDSFDCFFSFAVWIVAPKGSRIPWPMRPVRVAEEEEDFR